MCGLYGLAGDLSYRDKDTLKILAQLSILRGEDSAGLVAVPFGKDDPQIIKTLGTSYDLFQTKQFDTMGVSAKRMLIGHTRKATVGGVTKRAAHPFNYDHIYGVHNGTLDSQRWRKLPCGEEVSDSATLYKSFAEIGARDTIEQLAGAWACVWYDQNEDTLNILRNSQRTLFYAFSKDYKKIMWASEAWMLHIASQRSDFDMADLSDKDAEYAEYVKPFEKDKWFKIKIGAGAKPITFLDEETVEGDLKKPASWSAPFPRYGQSSGQGVPRPFPQQSSVAGGTAVAASAAKAPLPLSPDETQPAVASTTTSSSTSASQSTTPSSSQSTRDRRPTLTLVPPSKSDGCESSEQCDCGEPKREMVLVDDNVDDIGRSGTINNVYGNPMTKEDFEKCDSQCQFCQADVTYEDAVEFKKSGLGVGVARWLSNQEFLCSTCVKSQYL